MIITTTPTIEGKPIREYLDVISSEIVIGANFLKDFKAGIRDIIGGRSSSYEKVLKKSKSEALDELKHQAMQMGAHAIVGLTIDYETINNMMIVCAKGTAVKL